MESKAKQKFSVSEYFQRYHFLAFSIGLSLGSIPLINEVYAAKTIDFNTDVLDVNDRNNIDLSQFSRAGYIMPGNYLFVVRVNDNDLPETSLQFLPVPGDEKDSFACLTPELVGQFGLKPDVLKKVSWVNNNQCLDIASVSGMTVRGDVGTAMLYVSIPQAWLEYTAANWDPPSRWDDGIAGLMLDYNLNGTTSKASHSSQRDNLSGNGLLGANLGAWRLRAEWQMQHDSTPGPSASMASWSRFYAYRALTGLQAKMVMGETYLDSSIFDSFGFTGASLASDDNQLAPNLREYAPEVSGVAKTNAKIVISQQGRVIYESQVAAGPFRIQDLSSAVTGTLNVRVEEQDGSVQTFQVDTANIPYLTRPGRVRYKFAMGRASRERHQVEGPLFASGEFSWGVANGWSLYNGLLSNGEYSAVSAGIGRDLMMLGAISIDATQSHARTGEGTKTGGSYRISYSKRFESIDSQVTFAGYRFSQRNFMNMSQYLEARRRRGRGESGKELYTVTVNKHFYDWGLSGYLNYSHQTYWDKPGNDRWSVSLARTFSMGSFKNLNVNLSAYRQLYNGKKDDGAWLSLSVPLGSSSVSYSLQNNENGTTQNASWYSRLDERNSMNVSAGLTNQGRSTGSAYYTHNGSLADITANGSYTAGQYSAIGLGATGGVTLTSEGMAAHRINNFGGTRLLIDTDGVADVPIRGYGVPTRSNVFGKAVIGDVNSYYRNTASIDINQISDTLEVPQPVAQITMTEGAIGFRKFSVISGMKLLAVIRLADGTTPPFGASVMFNGRETGIVNDEGNVWLSGVQPGVVMNVRWSGENKCAVTLPMKLPETLAADNTILLPCILLTENSAKSDASAL